MNPTKMTPSEFAAENARLASAAEAAPLYSEARAAALEAIAHHWRDNGYPSVATMWMGAANYCRSLACKE